MIRNPNMPHALRCVHPECDERGAYVRDAQFYCGRHAKDDVVELTPARLRNHLRVLLKIRHTSWIFRGDLVDDVREIIAHLREAS